MKNGIIAIIIIQILIGTFSVGLYVKGLPFFSNYSVIAVSLFPAYVLIISAFLLAGILFYFYLDTNVLLGLLSITALIIFSFINYPLITQMKLANSSGAQYSILKNLLFQLNTGTPNLEKSIVYNTVGNQDLHMDYHPPKISDGKKIKPLILIHGGGFIEGNRGQEPYAVDFFTQLGYAVFDLEYRLSNYKNHTWNTSAQDVNTAIVFLTENAAKYNLDMSQLVLRGSSAGASLAMQASYGGTETFAPLIQGAYTNPKKIIAVYPAPDLEALWNQDTKFLNINSRDIAMQYIGGGPSDFPQRYEQTNVMSLAKQGVPETLVIHGGADTLIPFSTVKPLHRTLNNFGVNNAFYEIPYNIHGYNYNASSIAAQITESLSEKFLEEK